MKRFNRRFFIFIAAVVIFTSCGKDGAVGPAGPMGATGPQGPVGPAGPAGANGQNGSVIYSGTTAPAAATGAIGDFYLNTSTGLLYGPKTAGGWGSGFSLVGSTGAAGAAGAAGTPGSKTYSGSGAPSVSVGITGDYYLDKTNYLLYGPKTAGGWGTPINLQGPQGSQGNANVMTDVFSVGGTQWIWNSVYEFETSVGGFTEYFTRYYVRLNNTVTQNVLDNGLVLVYFTPSPVNNPNQWEPLSYQFDSSFGYTYNYVYVTSVGQVTLHYFFIQTDPTATVPTLSSYNDIVRKFKIVTITGQTGVFMLAHHVNLNNYQEVSKATGLWQQDKLIR